MERLRKIWRDLRKPHGAVWLPVLPPAGAFAELAVLMGVIHLINFVAPDIDVLNLEPSPYWLPILLLSLQYGTVAGLLAAGLATFAYVMNGLPEQNVDEHHFAFLLRVWSLPMLWIGVALVLGQFRMRQIELKQQLKTQLQQRTKEARALTGYVHQLERRCAELERTATSRVTTGGSVLDSLAAIGRADADVGSFLDQLGKAAFPDAQLAVYLQQSSILEAVVASGGGVMPRRINSDHPLFRAVVGERQAVSVLDEAGEKILNGEGLAAVPIVHDESGRVIGLLKLEQARGDVLTSGITERLAVTASLLAPMLSEPRIVVDNTAERQVVNGVQPRASRKRRRFGWVADEPSDRDGRASPRPRITS